MCKAYLNFRKWLKDGIDDWGSKGWVEDPGLISNMGGIVVIWLSSELFRICS